VIQRCLRVCAALVLSASLGACAAIRDSSLFEDGFWESSPFIGGDQAELGIAELSKGNYIAAENFFQKALRVNPKDVHALIGAGILYQNTGQLTKAREMYEAVLALRPPESEQFIVLQQVNTRPISQIASVNLSMIESGGVLGNMTAGAGQAPAATMGDQPLAAQSSGQAMMARPQAPAAMQPQMQSQMQSQGGDAMPADVAAMAFADGDSNIVSRFTTLKALRDQGLITPDEYAQRRQSNVGALLPLTAPPPAAGLDRPVPSTEQISSRLNAISRALQMKAITVSQHASERALILDALMPAAPVQVANPGPPPQGLLEAADSVRRLEKLREDGFISSDEYVRERAAIEAAVQTVPGGRAPSTMAASGQGGMQDGMMAEPAQSAMAAPEPPQPAGPQPAVHLASYKSQKNADRGWTQLKRAHAAQLGDLSYTVKQVNLGSKGTFYRLIAGPLPSQAEAASLCRDLKRRRQFCEPTFMNN
jgi:tetratricopeptide (TPR) repeat protein